MAGGTLDLAGRVGPDLPPKTDYRIGCIGAGFIMKDIHLVAYAEAGFDVVAIASRTPANARAAAEEHAIGTVHDTWQELLDDERVEIVDIAFPPDQQLEIVREAARRPHIKGILAQKPIAFTLDEAVEMVRVCDEAGVKLGVNHNMRYDQSVRALKALLDEGVLGEPVVAEVVMNARPHWQDFVKAYGRIALLNMSIHHLDAFRYLFGDPERIVVPFRDDPSHDFPHEDGMAFYVLEYASGLRAIGLDNCFTWTDHRIEWRVEGLEGIAKGTIGWPDYPEGSPSTIDWTTRAMNGEWERPRWEDRWFPQAFKGTMGQLMRAIQDDTEPEISGRTTLGTMALIEAAYRSGREGRAVSLSETTPEAVSS
jgi:predicted dehydrogenase